MQKIFIFLISTLLSLQAHAEQQGQTYKIQSGTGFFVNRQHIITNAHVVQGCKEVMVKGAIPEHKAIVRATNSEKDLALLETNIQPNQFAPLRFNIDSLKTGDKVFVIGYPGEAGTKGEVKIAIANVLDIKLESSDNSKSLYISDVVEHGNSGGPVFDTGGNVIGVVVAKALFTSYRKDTKEKVSEQGAGVAITLNTLKQFLLDNGVFSEWSGSGVSFADNYVEERAKDYIVNIQCRLSGE